VGVPRRKRESGGEVLGKKCPSVGIAVILFVMYTGDFWLSRKSPLPQIIIPS
jgi:hypothetical protein